MIEQLGLVRMVDRHVLDLALDFLTDNPQLQLAINISGLTASDQSWLRRMSALLKGRPDVAKRLIVEVTETSALIDIEESRASCRPSASSVAAWLSMISAPATPRSAI